MPLIEWQDSFSVGIDIIDSDHQILMGLINQLYDAHHARQGVEVMGSILNVLTDYVERHFAREEFLMDKAAYAQLAEHRQEHKKFIAQFTDIRDRYNSGSVKVLDAELLGVLTDWLIRHILDSDMRYKSHIQGILIGEPDLLVPLGLVGDGEDDAEDRPFGDK